MLEILRRDGMARICSLETPHGTIETPALLPVVNPRLLTIAPAQLKEEFGFKALIANSYIIRNDPKLKEKALSSGLHELLGYDGVVMTDSGTFQSHMYGEVEVANADIVDFQRDIGSDIGTVLDIFTEPEWSKEKTADAVRVTLERTREAVARKGKMMLAGVVQGSIYPDLREECALALAGIDADVHPIGGVVPLMEQYRFSDLVDVIIASKKGLTPARPVHLFGAGHPMVFALAALLGCDMFDSASYAKYARDGRYMFNEGTMHLKDMKGLECECPACQGKTIETLMASPEKERVRAVAAHNLHVCSMEIKRIKRAIREGDLWELAERRCRAHPALLDGLRRLKDHREFLEMYEPISRDGALFYTGPETLSRPAFLRYDRRLKERYQQPMTKVCVGFEERDKPYSRVHAAEMGRISKIADAHFIVISPFGPVPMELDEIYPLAQSVFPKVQDREMAEQTNEKMEDFSHRQQYGICVIYDGEETERTLESIARGVSSFDLDTARVKATADYQFGKGAADAIFDGPLELVKSKNTDRIRNIIVSGEHVMSLRAEDGLYSLRAPGARRLHKMLPWPRLRIVVKRDSIPFNREGKNVFCTFIADADPDLRPGDDALIVDENDELVAIGRPMLTRDEMMRMRKGMAVRVREGIPKA
jgi:7-cyano-7-deazaguanine tRNA-ribosyltransferase